ncbi:MAG: SLC13 family permease, partial [Dehalococcoidia bacterium]|nr:SLC13 family permease [Dehalococcoidia bacterium]
MDINQILALSIFIIMFVFIILDKWHRCLTALVAAIAVIGVVFLGAMHDWQVVLDVFNLRSMLQGSFWLSKQGGHALHSGINWQTIIFITGMMIMAERLASTGLFRWMCLYMARLVKCNVPYILVAFILLSGLLSMFIDSI